MSDPLLSCWVKLNRAKKHFNDLHVEIDGFKGRNPYRTVVDGDSEPAIKIFRLRIVEAIPVHWSGYIGDIIHNLRSSLDTLASALVRQGGFDSEQVMQETYFPIHWQASDLRKKERTLAFFERAGPVTKKLICRLQPYRRGKGHALWRLDQLDIIDKHRAIVPVGANLADVRFAVAQEPTTFKSALPMVSKYPLKEGDELYRAVFHQPQFHAHSNFVFEVVFGEGKIVDGEPVLPTLAQLIDFVERVLRIFAKYAIR
jgi:hypothetical protein